MGIRHPNHPGELSTDAKAAERMRSPGEINARARAIELLLNEGVEFLVGGAYAYCQYTGIYRDTKDLDLFLRRADAARALEVLAKDGWRTEQTNKGWIFKAYRGEWFVDLIFSSGNGVAEVDDEWFENAIRGRTFDHDVLIVPAEEVIWSKAFVQERERYDGSDVAHLIEAVGPKLDWERLLRRFDRYWEVLLSHAMLFRFAYPSEASRVPEWVMSELLHRAVDSLRAGDWKENLCRGNLLSSVNYTLDVEQWGYGNGRAWDERERICTRNEHANADDGTKEAARCSGG